MTLSKATVNRVGVIVLAFITFLPIAASAETYPARSITMIYPYSAGSSGDVFWRMVANSAGAALRQTIIFENRPGSAGRNVISAFAAGRKDGYLIGVGTDSELVNLSIVNPSTRVEAGKDYGALVHVFETPLFMYANPAVVPFRDLKGMVAFAKNNPGKLNVANSSFGGIHHIFTLLMNSKLGIVTVPVAYKGGADTLAALLAGQVQLSLSDGSHKPYVESGKLIGIGTTGVKRSPLLPDLPPFEDSAPGLSATAWHGVIYPVGIPTEAIVALSEAFASALKNADVQAKARAYGYEITGYGPDRFLARIQSDFEARGPVAAMLKETQK